MAGRHGDLQTVMMSGQLPEVARISQLMTNAAQKVAPVDPRPDDSSFRGGEHSEVIAHQCGLLGVRVGDASHPGPRFSQRSRRIVQSVSSSDEEPLLASHRNVIPRVTGATSVTGATQLDVEAMEPSSVPETILDALEEDLVRRNRRLVLVDGSRRQGSTTETDFTQWDSDAQFSMPSRPSEFQSQIVDVTVMDSDSSPVVTPRHLAVEGTQPAQVDSLSANRFAPLEDDDPRIADSSNESETLSVVNPEFVDRVQEVPLFPRDDSVAQVRHPQGAMIEDITVSPAIRTALRSLDEVDVQHLFRDRAVVMKHCEMFGVTQHRPGRR